MAEWWANTSAPPPSGVMKPNPLFALNHFTVPIAMRLSLGLLDAAPRGRQVAASISVPREESTVNKETSPRPDRMQVAQPLDVRAEQAGLGVRHAVLPAEVGDQPLGVPQVRPRHAGEQMMLDLIVEATEDEIGQPAAPHVAGGEDLA